MKALEDLTLDELADVVIAEIARERRGHRPPHPLTQCAAFLLLRLDDVLFPRRSRPRSR